MPSPNLLMAPAGAGKTEFIINKILKTKIITPWHMVWVLVPTETQVTAFQDRLLAHYVNDQKENAYFGVQFFTFYQLYTHLLDHMHIPVRQIGQTGVYRILRYLTEKLDQQNKLPYYHPIVEKPGFISLLSGFINELKQARVEPEGFAVAAEKGDAADRDLATIYDAYQQFLRDHQLVDREGAGWLALDNIEQHPDVFSQVCLLVVDGYQQFSPLQAKLLATLSGQIKKSWLSLTYEQKRARGIHRTFNRTRERLQKYNNSGWREMMMSEQPKPPHNTQRRQELSHLESNMFNSQGMSIPANDAVLFIEAPDAEQESRAVLRQVRALLMEGVPPESMVVVARNLERYAGYLRAAVLAYEIPAVFRQSEPLQKNPAVAALLNLIDLHSPEVEFRRQSVLDILHSPYFSIPDLIDGDIEVLEQISLKYSVVRSREDWLDAVQRAAAASLDEDGEPHIDLPVDEELYDRLAAFFNRITPVTRASVRDYIAWLQNLLGPDPEEIRESQSHFDPDDESQETAIPAETPHLDFYACVRRLDEKLEYAEIVVRDIHALHGLRGCLHEILSAYDLLRARVGEEMEASQTWDRFRADLQMAIEHASQEPVGGTYRSGRVLMADASQVRGLPHPYVFIMGLSEGIFPAPNPENILYGDRKRYHLRREAGIELQTAVEQVDDAAVFYELCAMAQQRLILSRPTLDKNANFHAESVLWREVQQVLTDAEVIHYRAGQPPELNDVADMRELGVALAAAVRRGEDLSVFHGIHAWLLENEVQSLRWENVLHGRSIEAHRMDGTQGFDHYSGILESPDSIAAVDERLPRNRLWSASQFNDYGYCPFRFFAKRLLKLEAIEEPVEGYDAAQLGSVQHELLEHTYRRFQKAGITIGPNNQTMALETLQEVAHKLLPDAPQRFGFRSTALWYQEQQEIMDRLLNLVALDFSDEPESPFIHRPRARNQCVADVVDGQPRRVYDVERKFVYEGDFRAIGFIDRIDIVGNQLILMDYKSGTQMPSSKDMEAGRNFQMMLYLLAVQQMVATEAPDLQVGAGFFWSIKNRKTSGEIRADDPLIAEALATVEAYIQWARDGDFRVKPRKLENGKCFKYCEFSQLCRRGMTRVYE